MHKEMGNFMIVKQKLDYYQLPTIFPYEMTQLLYKIFTNVEKKCLCQIQVNNNQVQKSCLKNYFDEALIQQISTINCENNKLHLKLISSEQQIIDMKNILEKIAYQSSNKRIEIERILEIRNQRQKRIFAELEILKYKYNELMQMIHQDEVIEKHYLKRLLKKKNMNITDDTQLKSTNKSIIAKMNPLEFEKEIKIYREKLINRENQIHRLQKKLENNGINMNKILQEYKEGSINNNIKNLSDQIESLTTENHKIKAQKNKFKALGGKKQALRTEVNKCHQQIIKLKQENIKLIRLQQQTKNENKHLERMLLNKKKQDQEKIKVLLKSKTDSQIVISELHIRLGFMTKQNERLNIHFKNEKSKVIQKQQLIRKLEQETKSSTKQDEIFTKMLELQKQCNILQQEIKLKTEAIQNLEKIVEMYHSSNSTSKERQFSKEEINFHQIQNRYHQMSM